MAAWWAWFSHRFETGSDAGHIAAMEGMRGVAILLVFYVHFHVTFSGYLKDGVFRQWSHYGYIAGHSGVDLFFVISGYLIYGMVLRPGFRYRAFLARRAWRIYPTFHAVLAAYLAASLLAPERSKLPVEWIARILYLVQNALLMPGLFDIRPMITLSWSLSYEWCFYLLLPVVVLGLRLRLWPAGARVAFWLTGTAGYWLFCHSLPSLFYPEILLTPQHIRLTLFTAGILLWEAAASERVRAVVSKSGEWLSWMAFGLALSSTVLLPRDFCLPVLGACFWWFSLRAYWGGGSLNRLLSTPLIRHAGNISYSFYLSHGIALHALAWVLRMADSAAGISMSAAVYAALLLPGSLLWCLAVAAGLYLAVEKPLSLDRRRRVTPLA